MLDAVAGTVNHSACHCWECSGDGVGVVVGVFSGVTVTPEGLEFTANCVQISHAHKMMSSLRMTSHCTQTELDTEHYITLQIK